MTFIHYMHDKEVYIYIYIYMLISLWPPKTEEEQHTLFYSASVDQPGLRVSA